MWIGSHSVSHPYLSRIKKAAVLRREIFESKRMLEAKLSVPVTAFAYPFGQYSTAITDLVRQAGYTAARSTYFGVRHTKADLFTLTGLINVTSAARIQADLSRALKEEEAGRPATPPPGIDPEEYE
jgi:peptidoglycan/xylan/chitin deacetylase (PgdA/CDA1 family)